MYISSENWKNYINKLSACSKTAAAKMKAWILKNGFSDTEALIDYAYALVTKYGEGTAALSAEMYDATAEMAGMMYAPAEVAPTPDYNEVGKAINGVLKHSRNADAVSAPVDRLVKRTGADTTLKNAKRDGAQFAWVPMGDTCAFCLTLASRGWQYMSEKALKNGHAEHIHAHCDCTYAIRFDDKSGVQGYDPDKYKAMYDAAEGETSKDKINSMRRAAYVQNKDEINAQKRAAYALRNGQNSGSIALMKTRDITEEYNQNSRPGIGTITKQAGFIDKDHIDEIETAKWILNTFGGDITLLKEDNINLTADYEWNGRLWDLKVPTKANKNTFEKRIKHGLEQISANPGGIIVDSSQMHFDSLENAEKFITNGIEKKAKTTTDCIIKRNDEYKVIRIIKE